MDYVLLASVLALLAYGVLMLYSATFYVGIDFWYRQLIWIVLGFGVMFVLLWIPYALWQKLAPVLMAVALLLLILVLFFGVKRFNAVRAFEIGPISVQPGVLARLAAVIYVAAWLASKGEQLNRVTLGLIPFGVIVGTVAGLVALQPDLSTAALIALTGLMMFFYAGGDPIQIFISLLIIGFVSYVVVLKLPYASDRWQEFQMSMTDFTKMDHHPYFAYLSIGEGGLFGVGIGAGRLKFGYLPVPHTDSIFAVIGEEVGLVGCLVVLAMFGFFAYRGYRVTLETPDPFGSLVAFGVTSMLVLEAVLNILVMIRLFPFTGTALPFFTYGGSEMMITMAGIGLLLGISRGRQKGDLDAILDRWWGDWRARLSRSRRRPGYASRRP